MTVETVEVVKRALATAETFIAGELAVLEKSFLPGPDRDEAEAIRAAKEALAEVRAAAVRLG